MRLWLLALVAILLLALMSAHEVTGQDVLFVMPKAVVVTEQTPTHLRAPARFMAAFNEGKPYRERFETRSGSGRWVTDQSVAPVGYRKLALEFDPANGGCLYWGEEGLAARVSFGLYQCKLIFAEVVGGHPMKMTPKQWYAVLPRSRVGLETWWGDRTSRCRITISQGAGMMSPTEPYQVKQCTDLFDGLTGRWSDSPQAWRPQER